MPSRELVGLQTDTKFKYASISTPEPKSIDIITETALRSKHSSSKVQLVSKYNNRIIDVSNLNTQL